MEGKHLQTVVTADKEDHRSTERGKSRVSLLIFMHKSKKLPASPYRSPTVVSPDRKGRYSNNSKTSRTPTRSREGKATTTEGDDEWEAEESSTFYEEDRERGNNSGEVDNSMTAQLLKKHIEQLEAALLREKIRREECENELKTLKLHEGDKTMVLEVKKRTEELIGIGQSLQEDVSSTVASLQARVSDLELRLSRFIKALDDKSLLEEAKSHVGSLTTALKESRTRELKYIESNASLILQEGNNLFDFIMKSSNSKESSSGGSGSSSNNSSLTPSTAADSNYLRDEVRELELALVSIEKQLEAMREVAGLNYEMKTIIPVGMSLRTNIDKALADLKGRHEEELKRLKDRVFAMEGDYLRGTES
jgi:hypothetical protein